MAISKDSAMQAAATIVAARIAKASGPVDRGTIGKWLAESYDTVFATLAVVKVGANDAASQAETRKRLDTLIEEINRA